MKKLNRRKRLLLLSFVLFALLAAVYIFGLLIPETAYAGSFMEANQSPSMEHPFGTDALGRDLLMRTLKGMSVSISIGLAASIVSAVIAVIAGLSAASGSKLLDPVMCWITDLVMSIPHTILVMLISFSLGRGLKGLLVGIAATHWCSLARIIRAEALQVKGQHYVAISRSLGRSRLWILRYHFLPHLLPQFLVGLVLLFPHAILHEASISFLGFGLPPEQPAIGIILAESMRYISAGMWWPAVFPGLLLFFTVLLFDRIGESLRKLLDPYSAQE